jgi:putative cell wall-binding protein
MTPGLPVKDKLVKRYDRTLPQLLAATREVLKRNGTLIEDNIVGNALHAKVNQRYVFVKLEEVDAKVTQVTVQARSSMTADIDLASEMQTQIALQLAATP